MKHFQTPASLLTRIAAPLALMGMLLGAGPATGQDESPKPAPKATADPRVDAATGRDLGNYSPDRLFDHEHMLLEITIPDLNVKEFSAKETLRVSALGAARSVLTLDARTPLTIKTVTHDGAPLAFTHENEKLAITFAKPVAIGQQATLIIEYSGKEPSTRGNGLCWFTVREATEDRPAVDPMIYSQGEASWNSLWFPCHDWPNERLTTEIIATVPTGFEVVSNGRLLTKEPAKDNDKLTAWHWLQDKPHANYLVMLAIGKWDIVELGGPESKRPNLSIPVYGKPGSAEALKKAFANTPEMIAFFETKFDEPYPWDKYAQVLVKNFRWGGMENTSATTLADFAGSRGPGDGTDELISHELGHQWFGDLVTCRSWEHLWINEGWATYCEALWAEHKDGDKGYMRVVRNSFNTQKGRNRASAPKSIPMVSNLWKTADDTFTKVDDVYSKGGCILHMLRKKIGDEAFFAGTRLYLDRHKFTCAETNDFRRVMEEVSGQSLERFFIQWAYRPGLPRLNVAYTWDESTKQLGVTVEQTQIINADNPAYELELPLVCRWEDAQPVTVTLKTDTKTASATFPLARKPGRIEIDPQLTVLAASKVTKKLDEADAPAADKPAAGDDKKEPPADGAGEVHSQ